MKLPSWLDPWWHIEYETTTTLSLEAARAVLTQRTGRLRGRVSPDGQIVLIRRGGLLNEFVRARADLSDDGRGTRIRVRIARPRQASVFMTAGLAFLFIVAIVNVIYVALKHGISAAMVWLLFLALLPPIWAAVVGANYTSARSEAGDLKRLISQALERNPPQPS